MLQQLVNFLFALIFYKVQLFTDYKKINSQYSSPASSTTKTGHHDIAESDVKTPKINQIKS
jgi:hypothetical protein